MDENTFHSGSISDQNNVESAEPVEASHDHMADIVEGATTIAIGHRPRKNAAVMANPARPLRHRRSFSYARRQR